jgi:hypothetical protein
LYFLALHGHVRFDWEWLIAAGNLGIWGQFARAGIQVDLEPFIQLGMRLQYSKTSLTRMLQ